MKNKIDLTYLGDVLDAIKRIESYLRKVDKEDFLENHMMQDAVMHQIEIIGMASNNVSDEFQERHPELPWMFMRAIRNKIASRLSGNQSEHHLGHRQERFAPIEETG